MLTEHSRVSDFSYTGGYERLQMHLNADEIRDIDNDAMRATIVK